MTGISQVEAFIAVHTLVAELAILEVKEIAAITNETVEFSIVRILCLFAIENEVAILQAVSVVRIFAIDVIRHGETADFGNRRIEFFELFKEGTGKIILSAIVQRTPLIPPPARMTVHSEFFLRRVDGNEMLRTKITGASIEIAFIAHRKAPQLTAVIALYRRWNEMFLSANCGRNFVVKRKILLRHVIPRLTVRADIVHRGQYR